MGALTPLDHDGMLIEPLDGGGWIAYYRLGPSAGSSGRKDTLREALDWLLRVESLQRLGVNARRVGP